MTLPHKHETALHRQLLQHEGLRLKPYRDTEGHLTIGIGHLLSKGISRRVAEAIFEDDLEEATTWLVGAFPWVTTLDPVRQRVLIDMAFNLGPKLGEFRNTLRAVRGGDWAAAAAGMRNSLWAKQVGGRAETLAQMMETGKDPFADDEILP